MTEKEILKDRYQLLRPIGIGRFGEVWMANDLRLYIIVMVKVYATLKGNVIPNSRPNTNIDKSLLVS